MANHITPTASSDSSRSGSALESHSPPRRNHSLRISHMPSAASQHRQSFNELRGAPPSPRSQRTPSISSLALQELIDNPPPRGPPDPRFTGRDWQTIKIQELTSPEDLRFVQSDVPVEAATNVSLCHPLGVHTLTCQLLISSNAPVLLIREEEHGPVVGTFDYRDLNAYLLMVIGLAQPDEDHIADFVELTQKAREGKAIPLRSIQDWGKKEPLTFLPGNSDLVRAIEVFGRGLHRIVVTDTSGNVTGLLSQSRLIRFLWEEGRHFPVLEQLHGYYLRDLKIGSHSVIGIK